MPKTSHSKRGVFVPWVLLSVAAFAYSYFQVIRKNWSLQMALLLSLVAGIVSSVALIRIVRANHRALRKKESDDDSDA